MTGRPPDLEAVHRDLGAFAPEAQALLEGLDDDAVFWQPEDGRAWSLAQCLDHMSVANGVYLEAMRAGLERSSRPPREGPIAPGLFGRFFVNSLEPPARKGLRMKAPRTIAPGPRRRRADLLPAFERSLTALRALIDEVAGLDLNRVTFANPFVSVIPMGVGTGLLVVAAHCRRHLWQARNVRNHPGLPGAR